MTIKELTEKGLIDKDHWLNHPNVKTEEEDIKIGINDVVIWMCGTWKGGIWKNGLWKNGTWRNGIWKDGRWEYGIWKGGLWKDVE